MPKKADSYHSILIVSSSEQFDAVVKKSLQGFVTIDVRRSAALARRCVLEKYYDLVVVNSPLPDETGEDFAIDAADRGTASVLLTVPQDVFGDALVKCATTNAAITNREANNASKIVMITTFLPTALSVEILKDVPIEKAMNPNAIVLTHLILSTKP